VRPKTELGAHSQMHMDQDSATQMPVPVGVGDRTATALPSRFAETSGTTLPTSVAPATLQQMTIIPWQQLTTSGFTSTPAPALRE
jgi:hypothetical protein